MTKTIFTFSFSCYHFHTVLYRHRSKNAYLVGEVIGYRATTVSKVASRRPNRAYVKLHFKHTTFKPHVKHTFFSSYRCRNGKEEWFYTVGLTFYCTEVIYSHHNGNFLFSPFLFHVFYFSFVHLSFTAAIYLSYICLPDNIQSISAYKM